MTEYLIYLFISEGCLWKNYTTLHPGEGLASSDITDKIQNHGCINECVRTDNEVYVIAQVESGNNDLVIPSLRIDNWSLGYAQYSGKYIQK